MHSPPPRIRRRQKEECGQGSGPESDLIFKERSDYENGSAGERRVCEARDIMSAGRNRFEFGSIESPYKRQDPFSGNPFLPARDKATDSGRFRALRARGGGSKIQK